MFNNQLYDGASRHYSQITKNTRVEPREERGYARHRRFTNRRRLRATNLIYSPGNFFLYELVSFIRNFVSIGVNRFSDGKQMRVVGIWQKNR